jgi:hypothetical protein
VEGNGKARVFVLKDKALNLWDGICEDAKQYFKKFGTQKYRGNADALNFANEWADND